MKKLQIYRYTYILVHTNLLCNISHLSLKFVVYVLTCLTLRKNVFISTEITNSVLNQMFKFIQYKN